MFGCRLLVRPLPLCLLVTPCPCALHSALLASGDLCAGLLEPGNGDRRMAATCASASKWNRRRVNLLQHLSWCDAGVCGLGPATRLLRRMNSLLRLEILRRKPHEENDENVRKCLVVQRKDGGGREVTNHDELLRVLHLLPSACAGRWQVGCLCYRVAFSCVVE